MSFYLPVKDYNNNITQTELNEIFVYDFPELCKCLSCWAYASCVNNISTTKEQVNDCCTPTTSLPGSTLVIRGHVTAQILRMQSINFITREG